MIGTGAPPVARFVARLPGLNLAAPTALRAMVRLAFAGALRTAWADPSKLDEEVIDGYRRPLLRAGVLESMWSLTAHQVVVPVDWHALHDVPVLVIRGDSDRWTTPVPLPDAREVIYSNCGHMPHEEDASRFVEDVETFLDALPEAAS